MDFVQNLFNVYLKKINDYLLHHWRNPMEYSQYLDIYFNATKSFQSICSHIAENNNNYI